MADDTGKTTRTKRGTADDIVTRLRDCSPPNPLGCVWCEAADEIVRLRADVEQLTNGNNIMGLLWNAERALADQLAEALRWSWELTEATHDEVFGTMVAAHGALAAHKEARRG